MAVAGGRRGPPSTTHIFNSKPCSTPGCRGARRASCYLHLPPSFLRQSAGSSAVAPFLHSSHSQAMARAAGRASSASNQACCIVFAAFTGEERSLHTHTFACGHEVAAATSRGVVHRGIALCRTEIWRICPHAGARAATGPTRARSSTTVPLCSHKESHRTDRHPRPARECRIRRRCGRYRERSSLGGRRRCSGLRIFSGPGRPH